MTWISAHMKPAFQLRSSMRHGALLITACALATNSALADDAPVAQLEKVEITGSSIKRIDAETALPIEILKREDIARTGATNTEDLFRQIASMSSAGNTTTAQGTGFTTGGLSAISLRGLGADRTLVLINGRRASVYGGGSSGFAGSAVDVNSIPLAAIERVEILKDGASAVYGSDAIAGVVNFILRKDYKGAEISATYGEPTRGGGGADGGLSILAGTGDLLTDKYNLSLSINTQRTGAIYGIDRPFARRYNPGYGNDNTSAYASPANIFVPPEVFPPGGTFRNPGYPNNCGPYSFNDPNYARRCRFDNSLYDSIQPEQDRKSILLNGHLVLGESAEGYAELGYSEVKTHTQVQPVPLNFNLAPTSPYYPSNAYLTSIGLAGTVLQMYYRDTANGNRQQLDQSDNGRLVLGVKGSALGWDYDTSLLYTESKVKESLESGFPLYSLITPLLESGVVDVFGGATPASVLAQAKAAEFVGEDFHSKTSLTSLAGKVSRELYDLAGGSLGLAAGAELRQERFSYSPALAVQQGDIAGQGGNQLPESKSRHVSSGFLELDAPFSKSLEANAAIRFDDYENVGSTVNPKASLRWQPSSQFLVRASAGSGFRAPSLTDLYAGQASSVTSNGTRDPILCPVNDGNNPNCSAQFNTTTGGNPNLKPEKSRSYTLGVLVQPTRELALGADAFWIFLKDQISAGGLSVASLLASPQSATQFAGYITRDPLSNAIVSIDQRATNLFKSAVSGVDLDAKYAWQIAPGRKISLLGNGTYFFRYDNQNPDGSYSGQIDQGITSAPGVVARWRYTASAVYEAPSWSASITQNFQKHYHDVASNFSGVERDVGSYETYDVQASYLGLKSFKLSGGVKNLFNKDPPYANYAGVANNFVGGYDLSYGDPRGAFLYLNATYYLH
jgi:iron complex outermembrane receptor protein